jgi:energy-coupling factor transporter ATP-binding protein EcfA2
MVAGPNGSGKSTLFDLLAGMSFPLGHCLNPDRIERELATSRRFPFTPWGISTDEATVRAFFASHGLATKTSGIDFSVAENELTLRTEIRGGYFAAILSDFLRRQWLEGEQSFTFETVMSNPDKVDLITDARARGYRTYLYYVCTEAR